MDHALIGIDHLIIGVRDLNAARAGYARLGFNTTPLGRHVGWGTANACVMFEAGYLELLGILDPTQFVNGLDEVLKRGEGPFSVVLGTRDAQATQAAWAEAGLEPAPACELGRLLDGAPSALRFRNVMLERTATAGLGLFACEHLTPELLRRPAWLVHPNGARRLHSCTVVVDDPGPLAQAFARLLGPGALTRTDAVVAAHTGQGVVLIARPEDAALMHPMAEIPASAPEPLLRVVTVEVADVARAASFLARQGVRCRRTPASLLIPPGEAHGAALELLG